MEASHKLACFHAQSSQMQLLTQLLPHPRPCKSNAPLSTVAESSSKTHGCAVLLQRQDHTAAGHGELGWTYEKQHICARTGRLWHEDVRCSCQRLLINGGVKKQTKMNRTNAWKMLTCNMYFYYTFLKNRVMVKFLKTLTFFLNRNPYLTVLAFIKFCSLVPGSFI